ncbi:MAG: hypothetical protein AAF829_02285 [Pseudomonadota bacterium]
MQNEVPKRVIVKVGSSVLLKADQESLDTGQFAKIAKDIAWLKSEHGTEVMVMSSGALAAGRNALAADNKPEMCIQDTVLGAVGQVEVSNAWRSAFRQSSLAIGQLLLSPETVANHVVRECIESMFDLGIVPYANENIPTFTSYDNDGLAASLARAINCSCLVLLSDVEGVYTKNPSEFADAELVSQISDVDEAIHRFGGGSTSGVGTGGMLTKLKAAKLMHGIGAETIIASGRGRQPIRSIFIDQAGTRVTG